VSSKTDYSADEWKIVLRAPLMAGLAVVAASPSGPLGVLREMFAVGKVVAETKARPEGHGALLRALVVDLASPDGRASVDAGDLRGVAVEQLRSQALDACRASQRSSTGRRPATRPTRSSGGSCRSPTGPPRRRRRVASSGSAGSA